MLDGAVLIASNLSTSGHIEAMCPDAIAVVVGGGFGGMAAALRMRAKGYETVLIDRQKQLGGRAFVYNRGGFTFDGGPTIVTAPFLLDELFEIFDKKRHDYVEFVPCDPWYRFVFDDGTQFDYGGDLDQMLERIREFEPADVDGYLKLLAKTKTIFDVAFTKLADKPIDSLSKIVLGIPHYMRLTNFRTVWSHVSACIRNEKLRRVFSFQPILVGGNPFTTTCIYSLIHYLERTWGVHFTIGGTGQIVSALHQLMIEENITIRLGETVEEILVDKGVAQGVRLSGGEIIRSDIVISNADAPYLYREMIKERHRTKWTDKRVERLKFSMGLFVLYLGAKRLYPELAHHTVLISDHYREFIQDVFEKKVLSEHGCLYLHAPTRSDPTMAPPGCECLYALAPVPNLQSNVNWMDIGDIYADGIVEHLGKTVCPELKQHKTQDFYLSPLDFRSNFLSMHGSGFSIQPVFKQSAYFRFHNRSEDVRNLFLVGAGTHPGAGIPGVLCSAKVVAGIVPDASS